MAEEEQVVPKVRTYERDAAEFMAREGTTAAHAALSEQSRRVGAREEKALGTRQEQRSKTRSKTSPSPLAPSAPPPSAYSVPSPAAEALRTRARSLLFWSILLLVLAGVVVGGVWYIHTFVRDTTPPTPERVSGTHSSLILANQEKMLDVSRFGRDEFLSAFARERSAPLPLSSFSLIVPARADTPLSAAAFLELLSAVPGGSLVRTLQDEFVLGLRGLPANAAFLILKIRHHPTALAGMLAWEATFPEDLGPLFGSLAGGTAGFTDRVVRNRDLRVFSDTNGTALLVWGFANQETLIITNNEDSFAQILGKLIQ